MAYVRNEIRQQEACVSILVDSIFSVRPMSSESSTEIKRVFTGISSPLSSLKTLDRATKHWDDLLVHLTLSKIDSMTRKEWETSLGDSTNSPSFVKLTSFFNSKQIALEAFEASEKNKRVKGSSIYQAPQPQLGKSRFFKKLSCWLRKPY